MRIVWIIALGLIFVAWGLFVAALGGDFLNIPGKWDFSQTGVLGDSFGVIGALMATAAAIFTFTTMENERRTSKAREAADRKRETEQTFFRLLSLRNELISGITAEFGPFTYRGQEAISKINKRLTKALKGKSEAQSKAAYSTLYDNWRDQLGHYFRHTYHVILFADANFEGGENYRYIRWVRAQMSNSEQTLLALNCLYGEGRKSFKGLVEFHALLHNIHPMERRTLDLDLHFEPTAFDLPPRPRPASPRPDGLRLWAADRLAALSGMLSS
jgi:hypothetical protein